MSCTLLTADLGALAGPGRPTSAFAAPAGGRDLGMCTKGTTPKLLQKPGIYLLLGGPVHLELKDSEPLEA